MLRPIGVIGAVILLAAAIGACGGAYPIGSAPDATPSTGGTPTKAVAGSGERSMSTPTRPPGTEAITTALASDDPLVRDAANYAEHYRVPIDEAVRRLERQDEIGRLGALLESKERDTFAGLWIQHEPEYKIVVAFTRDGEATMERYVRDGPLVDLLEVREARVTLVELQAAQAELGRRLGEAKIPASTGIDVTRNRVQVYVSDLPRFRSALHEEAVQLPPLVELVTKDGPVDSDGGGNAVRVEPTATAVRRIANVDPAPHIHLPRQDTRGGEVGHMQALLGGEIVEVDGCLRVGSRDGSLIIWPDGYRAGMQDGRVVVLDGSGRIVARVGDQVSMGGGEVSREHIEGWDLIDPKPPAACPGPYWIAGEVGTAR